MYGGITTWRDYLSLRRVIVTLGVAGTMGAVEWLALGHPIGLGFGLLMGLLALIDRLAPDLVFLDVQMPDLDGFGVLRGLARPPRYVVFTTAYDRFALEAFAVGALDYLLKPFGERELGRAIARARDREAEARFQEGYQRLLTALERPRHLQSLPVTHLQNILLLPVGEIDCFEADSALEMVTVRTGGKSYSSELTLTELEQRLDPARFFRAHRRAILNLGKLLRLEPLEGGRYLAVLSSGERVEVSRSASRKLRERLGL
jgi:two-component system LytT family response regulator